MIIVIIALELLAGLLVLALGIFLAVQILNLYLFYRMRYHKQVEDACNQILSNSEAIDMTCDGYRLWVDSSSKFNQFWVANGWWGFHSSYFNYNRNLFVSELRPKLLTAIRMMRLVKKIIKEQDNELFGV